MKNGQRKNCEEILKVIHVMETGLRASLKGISSDQLNHSFAPQKMTIGQMAVHTMSWPRYFLSDKPPWKETEWTCRPCEYPLTPEFVEEVIDDGCTAMREYLVKTDDRLLEIDEKGKKGKGYILYRLQLHILVHTNQIVYLRSILDPSWNYHGQWGDMATALIAMDYHTSKELPPKKLH